jgi:hypothetical protein
MRRRSSCRRGPQVTLDADRRVLPTMILVFYTRISSGCLTSDREELMKVAYIQGSHRRAPCVARSKQGRQLARVMVVPLPATSCARGQEGRPPSGSHRSQAPLLLGPDLGCFL